MAFTLQQSLAIIAVAIFAHTSSAQENPICYVCSDNGVSTVTKPTNSIPLPSFLNVGPITCGQIQVAGEILRVLTPEACSYLNTNTFRVTCGCENAIATAPVAPVAAPVSVSAPTKGVNLVGGGDQMKGGNQMVEGMAKKTNVPTSAPTFAPTYAPTETPTLMPVKKNGKNDKKKGNVPIEPDIGSGIIAPTSSPTNEINENIIDQFFENIDEEALVAIFQKALQLVSAWIASNGGDVDPDVISDVPSMIASDVPSSIPSTLPSDAPSDAPSSVPSVVPSSVPSDAPSDLPSSYPSFIPSDTPSSLPSDVPSTMSSDIPSDTPSTDNFVEDDNELTFLERLQMLIKNLFS